MELAVVRSKHVRFDPRILQKDEEREQRRMRSEEKGKVGSTVFRNTLREKEKRAALRWI